MTTLVVATRSAHKLGEIKEILGDLLGVRLIDLQEAGIPPSEEEDHIEAFDTFEANALAKARYFAARTPHPVLADDSGICVDALDGAPGVFSKRFSGREDLSGEALDAANNEHLLSELRDVPAERRTAHYRCVLAVVNGSDNEQLFQGTVHGRILSEPRGQGGFGYDPLFFVPELGATFGEIPQAEKNRLSHRSRALEAARPALLRLRKVPAAE